MSTSPLYNEIVPYLEPDGLVDPKVNTGPSQIGNSVYRSLYYVLLAVRGELDDLAKTTCLNSINKTRVPNEEGLFYRSSYKTDELQAHDDIIGVAAESYFVDNKAIANEILTHGKNNFWSYNTLEPSTWSLRTFFARHPLFVAHIYFSAGKRPPLFWMIYWCVGILLCMVTSQTNATAWYLSWLSVTVAEKQSFVGRIMGWFWRKRLTSMKNILKNCLSEEHPLIKYMID